MRELFVVPMIGTGTRADPVRGRYTQDEFGGAFGTPSAAGTIRYSRQDDAVVMIDAPQAYLDQVAAQADALRIATARNLDQPITAPQATAAKAFLEARGIPQQMVNVGDTRREVLRRVVGMFFFSQRMEGRFGEGFKKRATDRGISLDSAWNTFPAALQNEFIAIRDDHGWGNLGLTATSTLREILQAVSQQYAVLPIYICGLRI